MHYTYWIELTKVKYPNKAFENTKSPLIPIKKFGTSKLKIQYSRQKWVNPREIKVTPHQRDICSTTPTNRNNCKYSIVGISRLQVINLQLAACLPFSTCVEEFETIVFIGLVCLYAEMFIRFFDGSSLDKLNNILKNK
jgi:hypothetical protein